MRFMLKTIGSTLSFILIFQMLSFGQTTRCDNIIFPGCPGSGGNGTGSLNTPTQETQRSLNNNCTYTILEQPMYGTVTIPGIIAAETNIDSVFLYETRTNCFPEDSFVVLECCDNDAGVVVCDTVTYMVHLDFVCETPPDKYCCLAADGQPQFFDVLQNDQEFVLENYPGFANSQLMIVDIVQAPSNGTADLGPNNNDLLYISDPGFTGLDSVVYQVEYILSDGIDEVKVCDEQTAYLLIEDCVQATPDLFTTMVNNTVCFEPLINDFIEPTLEEICPIQTPCLNPLPTIEPGAFMWLTEPGSQVPNLYPTGSGAWCFESPEAGIFTYSYQVCSTAGQCATSVVTFEVGENCPPVLQFDAGVIPPNIYQAENLIFSIGTVAPETQVRYKAGAEIILEKGFSVELFGQFGAVIEPCVLCWDINQNGFCDPEEDVNGDNQCNSLDCPLQIQMPLNKN